MYGRDTQDVLDLEIGSDEEVDAKTVEWLRRSLEQRKAARASA